MSNNSREYLKIAKPAFIADMDRYESGRTAMRLKVREVLRKANWRQLHKLIGASPNLSWRKRLALVERAMRQS